MVRFLIILLAGCATTATSTITDDAPQKQEPPRFPSAQQLKQIEESPAPEELVGPLEREADWTMEGPLPERIEIARYAGASAWDALLARTSDSRNGLWFPSTAMHCAAREIGRFYLAHEALPSARMRAFIANRCGSPQAEVLTAYQTGKIPHGAPDSAVYEHWHPAVEKLLTDPARLGQLAVGLAYVRSGDRGVVMLTAQPRRIQLEPLSFKPEADGRVELRGEILVPTDRVEALINRGRHGFARCERDERVRLPRFSVTCRADLRDGSARLEMGAFAPGRITGPIVLDLTVYPAQPPTELWVHHRAQKPTEGDLKEKVLGLVNQVRREAALPPLELAGKESAIAEKVAPHYFAALLGSEPEVVADQVVLGLRAGWEVEGSVRFGNFTAGAVQAGDAAELVAAALDRPSGRETLLDHDARKLAVGTFSVDKEQLLAGVLSTYQLAEADKAGDARRVLAALREQRQRVGRSAPILLQGLQSTAAEHAATIQKGRSPRAAMESLLHVTVSWSGGAARGFAVEFNSPEELRFPPELVNAVSAQVAIGVSSYKPAREPWTRYVAVIVMLEDTVAMADY